VKTILAAARERAGTGEPLRVVDDQVGSPTYAAHLAAAADEALQKGIGPGLYHLAGSGYCSWCELAAEIVDLAGLDVAVEPITTLEAGRPAPRPTFSALDTERPIPRLPHWAQGVAEAVDKLIPLG
jgi:dTDP-4-dehydrorhamnose reductase